VHIPTLGSSLLLPEGISQLLYLFFRGHNYPSSEELMREEELLSSSCAGFESHFSAGTEPPAQRRRKVVLVPDKEGDSQPQLRPLRPEEAGRVAGLPA
jgi:hypothetical protein